MLSERELQTLDAALARIVPDAHDHAVRDYVRERAAIQHDLYRTGLLVLQGNGFEGASLSEQDAILQRLEGHPSIILIVRHAVEGYYTSAAGMASVGFQVTA